jgi:GNAT superfamily N-acetyltransferase
VSGLLAAADVAALRCVYAGLTELAPALAPLTVEGDGLTALAVPGWPDHPWANAVVGLGAQLPVNETALDEALALLEGAGVTSTHLAVEDGASPRILLRDWLPDRGFTEPLRLVRYVAAVRPVEVPAGLRVVAVGPEDADDVVAVCGAGFGPGHDLWWRAALGRPGGTQLVAYDGDAPVATGWLHVSGSTAYVGGAATVPSARGWGAQAALLAARLRAAAEQGARLVTAKAADGTGSARNLERAGFVVAGGVTQWRRPAVASSQGDDGD